MKKISLLALALIIAITLMTGTASPVENYTYFAQLIAGQNTQVGWVYVGNDSANLYVKFLIQPVSNGWSITETHLHIASSLEEIPAGKKGNPKIGKFDHKTQHAPPGVYEVPYVIPLPLGTVPGMDLYIAAHAVVQSGTREETVEETAWGFCSRGGQFTENNWATYMIYTVRPWDTP